MVSWAKFEGKLFSDPKCSGPLLQTLPLKEVNKLFYTFLWNEKGDKIKRDIMINDYSNGGLKMIDIQSFNKSLKATWVKK